jgi:hypothetical protein
METLAEPVVRHGIVAYRRRLRAFGPFMALVLPAVALASALVAWQVWPCSGTACVRTGAGGFLLAALALPTALVFGLPWQGGGTRYLLVAGSSAVLWMVLGAWAAGRATYHAVASWRDWWKEFLWLLAGVWGGVVADVALLGALLSRTTLL